MTRPIFGAAFLACTLMSRTLAAAPQASALWPAGVRLELGAGLELTPGSYGPFSTLLQFGGGGGLRWRAPLCANFKVMWGTLTSETGTARVSEDRLRADIRPAFCPVRGPLMLSVGAGPAVGYSWFRARVGVRERRYSVFDFGATGTIEGAIRIGPVSVHLELETGWVDEFVLGAFFYVGLATGK